MESGFESHVLLEVSLRLKWHIIISFYLYTIISPLKTIDCVEIIM